jgi:hypothetical protein
MKIQLQKLVEGIAAAGQMRAALAALNEHCTGDSEEAGLIAEADSALAALVNRISTTEAVLAVPPETSDEPPPAPKKPRSRRKKS